MEVKIPLSKEVIKESAILKINAHQKLSTVIPEMADSAMSMTMALITREKSPSVIIVNGNPKIFKIGVTIRLSNPRTIAKMIAEVKPSKRIPVRI